MARLSLEIVRDDTPSAQCEYNHLNQMMKEAYWLTLTRKAKACHILLNGEVIGGCMYRMTELYEEDDEEFTSGIIRSNPVCEILYLVIGKPFRRNGYGRRVLKDLINEIRSVSEFIPIRYIIIEAFSDLVEWYQENGFEKYERNGKGTEYLNTVSMRLDLLGLEEWEGIQRYIDGFM